LKSAYIGLVFFAIYIAGVSSTVSNAVISISSAVVLLYTIYDYRQHKLSFPVPGADLQFVWWLFFIALILDSLFLADAEAVKKALDYLYLSLPFWLLLAFYYHHPKVRYFGGGVAAALIFEGLYSVYVFFFVNHMEHVRVETFAANLNGFGTIIAMSLPFTCALVAANYRENKWVTAGFVVSSILGLAALVLTGSRGAMLGFGVGCVVLVLAKLLLLGIRSHVKSVFFGLIICSLIVGGFAFTMGNFHRDTDNQRILFVKSSIAMWRDHPILGVGLTNWKEQYHSRYKLPQAFEKEISMPHNTVAFFFSTTGLLGGISFLIFTFGIFIYLCKYMRKQPDNFLIRAMLWSFVALSVHGLVDAGLTMRTALRLYSAYMGVTVASILKYEAEEVAKLYGEKTAITSNYYRKQRFYGYRIAHKKSEEEGFR